MLRGSEKNRGNGNSIKIRKETKIPRLYKKGNLAKNHHKSLLLGLLILAIMLSLFSPVFAQHGKSDSSAVITSPRKNLVAVPLPQLDRLDAPVVEQIESLQRTFMDLIAKDDLPDAELLDGYSTLGQLYHAYELTAPAESCYVNASRLNQDDYRWFHFLGTLSQQSGRLSAAADHYKIVRYLKPDYLAAAANLGTIYLQLNRLDEARQEFQAALAVDSNFVAAFYGLGQVALAEQKFSEAAKYFRTVLDSVPAANRVHYSLALAYRGMGEAEKAQQHLRQRGTVGIRPEDPLIDGLKELLRGERVYLIRGRMALRAGRAPEAAEAFSRAVDAKPQSVRARINLGVSLAQFGEVDAAIEQFRAALQYEPHNQNAHFNLGSLLIQKKKYKEAIQHLQPIIESNLNDLEATRELAKALAQAGREKEALERLFKAMELAPEDELTLTEVSGLLVDQKRYKEARDLLDEANRRFPDRGLTAHALARLLAACPDTSLRDGQRALSLANSVYQAKKSPLYAETLAMSLAEAGHCQEAITLQKQLIAAAEQLKDKKLAARFKDGLAHYERGTPCRPILREIRLLSFDKE